MAGDCELPRRAGVRACGASWDGVLGTAGVPSRVDIYRTIQRDPEAESEVTMFMNFI